MERELVMSDEARLINTLIRRYEKIGKVARPVVNSSKPVKVGLSLMLYQLIDVDESEQFITLKLWIHTVAYSYVNLCFTSARAVEPIQNEKHECTN